MTLIHSDTRKDYHVSYYLGCQVTYIHDRYTDEIEIRSDRVERMLEISLVDFMLFDKRIMNGILDDILKIRKNSDNEVITYFDIMTNYEYENQKL